MTIPAGGAEGMINTTGGRFGVSGLGRSGTGVLKVDGKEVARQTMERTIPVILPLDESFDIGADTLTGVEDRDYQVPFKLTAKLHKLTIAVDRPKLTPEDVQKLKEAEAKATDAK